MKTPKNNNNNLIKKIVLSLFILTSLAIGLRLLFAELPFLILSLGVLICFFYLWVYFYIDKGVNIRFCAWFIAASNFTIVFSVAYLVGGLESPVIIITPFVCVISFLLLSGKAPWVFTISTVLAILVFMTMQYFDYEFPLNNLAKNEQQLMKGVWLIFSTLMISLAMHYFKYENTRLEDKLYQESITDHLTGLYNRRFFEQFISLELSRTERKQSWLSVLLIDIDNFKLYNDSYGHQAGDACLKQISRTLKNHFKRSIDIIFRYGGEEFLVVLPDTDQQEAYDLAEDFRVKINNLNIIHALSPHKIVTVSIGVNSIHGKDRSDLDNLIKGADLAMYVSKNKGRNRTSISGDKNLFKATS